MQTPCSARQILRHEIIAAVQRTGIGLFLAVFVATSIAQEKTKTSGQPEPSSVNTQLPVNWLYGAYIPKNAPWSR